SSPTTQVFEGPSLTPQMYPLISSQRCTQSPQDAQIGLAHNRKMLQRNTTVTFTPSFASVDKKRKPQSSSGSYDKIATKYIIKIYSCLLQVLSIMPLF
ncbi:hypothetical protein WA026_021070, partial [Henosepilachna vigintioctopunctata]